MAGMRPELAEYRRAVMALDRRRGARAREEALTTALERLQALPLGPGLESNLEILQELFRGCSDAVFRRFEVGGQHPAALIYMDGMVVAERLENAVLRPLLAPGAARGPLADHLAAANVGRLETVGEAVFVILRGKVVLLVAGQAGGWRLDLTGGEQRAIEEPAAEPVIRGPREGFNENLRTGTALLRRKLRTPQLKIETMTLGRRSQTTVAIAYIQGIAPPGVVHEVRSRLERIDVDAVLSAGKIEELIEDEPLSPFPQIQNSERPDTVAGHLLEGRVAVLVDGEPFALTMPVTFWSFFQASEDYYERHYVAGALRILRYFLLAISLVGPSLYIAITTFHQEMLPTPLLISIAAAREGVPFPAIMEALLMEIFFEALREAGVRLPRAVGQAVSIVGALVIGEAAVRAGLASAPVVIIVSVTGIASFTVPRFAAGIAMRLLRFPMMFLAASAGLVGIMFGLVFILIHLSGLRSFGVPYLQPAAPFTPGDLKDVLLRAPWWALRRRPQTYGALDEERLPPGRVPGPQHQRRGGRPRG